ncbi:MAG: tetratricopeptide repeat protein [Candidatus Obscuribacterales bacterium]|nr:tetratricopeptide repeat protein [Candidatus Obscuribacterales bacterium]
MNSQKLPSEQADEILEYLRQTCGLSFSSTRLKQAEELVVQACLNSNSADLNVYFEKLKSSQILLDALVSKLTIQESYFFRDRNHYQLVIEQILPEILKLRGEQHMLRAWSAGCASGEEAYSLAILFEQYGVKSHLIGSDISPIALQNANTAVYRQWAFRQNDDNFARIYFDKRGEDYYLKPNIREKVRFEYLNLVQDSYPSISRGIWAMDVIFCRNVLIYIDPQLIPKIANRFFETLAEGGWLLTASSDPLLSQFAPFESIITAAGVFYRRPISAVSNVILQSINKHSEPIIDLRPPQTFTNSQIKPKSARRKILPVPPAAPEQKNEVLVLAKQSFASGDYAKTISITRKHIDQDIECCLLYLRSLANTATVEHAEAEARSLGIAHQFSVELHYMHALLLMELGSWEEALTTLKKVLYLDPSLIIVHFSLGVTHQRLNKKTQAEKSFSTVQKMCEGLPPQAALPLADGETAGRLAKLALFELNALKG